MHLLLLVFLILVIAGHWETPEPERNGAWADTVDQLWLRARGEPAVDQLPWGARPIFDPGRCPWRPEPN
jgi:hypothetical protein